MWILQKKRNEGCLCRFSCVAPELGNLRRLLHVVAGKLGVREKGRHPERRSGVVLVEQLGDREPAVCEDDAISKLLDKGHEVFCPQALGMLSHRHVRGTLRTVWLAKPGNLAVRPDGHENLERVGCLVLAVRRRQKMFVVEALDLNLEAICTEKVENKVYEQRLRRTS